MKIGFQTSKYNGLTLEEELNFAVNQNAGFFDIFFDEWLPDQITAAEHQTIHKLKMKNFPFTVHLPISTPKLCTDELHSLIHFVKELKPLTATLHFDTVTFEFLKYISDNTAESTVICIENTIPDKHRIYDKKYLNFMKEAVKIAPIQATFDTGHCYANHYDLIQTVDELCYNGIHIATVHAHDNDGTCDAHGTVGSGMIDFQSFFKHLTERKQHPLIVIEHWTDNVTSFERLQKIISNLQKL